MAFTQINLPQNEFLEQYLRGTGRSISSSQARNLFGIQNLRARMSEFRKQGLRVNTELNSRGRTAYSVSSRDCTGSRARVFPRITQRVDTRSASC